ncbi:MAG: hypothetical protein K0R69_490 [Clostridia bacterium]|jgi:cytidylate kinase|nr:hypothetical protein [Clostridia bacterium]
MKNYIITIARGFGSGGKTIGIELGKKLGIPCYENEILEMASEASGISRALFNQTDERLSGRLFAKRLKGIPTKTIISPSEKEFVSDINLFNFQSQIIRSLAVNESCIIIGKCADYVLEHFQNVYRIYIDAPREACVKSIANKMCVSEEEANRLITKTDKYRADYYKYYTGKDWTNPTNYDLFINSDRVGRERCADVIEMYVKYRMDL